MMATATGKNAERKREPQEAFEHSQIKVNKQIQEMRMIRMQKQSAARAADSPHGPFMAVVSCQVYVKTT